MTNFLHQSHIQQTCPYRTKYFLHNQKLYFQDQMHRIKIEQMLHKDV